MGLLDDAIREHLELKRQRGADAEEVARQEDEALGDPRNPEPAPEGAPVDVTEEPALDVPEFAAEAPAADPDPELEPVPEPPAAVAPEPEAGPPEPPAPRDEAWLDEEGEAAAQPTAEFTPPAEPEPEPESEPEAVAPDEEPSGDDDVLEETPDFLQETPEHDRLWFEQKPPRDFDFDN